MAGETGSPAAAPELWVTPADIPDHTAFTSCSHGGRWIRECAGYRYTATDGKPGALWPEHDVAAYAPFTRTEN